MTLGFSVEELVAAGRQGGALRMGLRRLPEHFWLQPDFDGHARATVFDLHPEAIRVAPGAERAAGEAAMLVAGASRLEDAARAVWEDLCILEAQAADGDYRLTAAALGFPTDWRLDDKMGLSVAGVHAPIHGYADQLSAGVDHLLRTIRAGTIFARSNWFVVASDAWRYLPDDDPAKRFAHVRAENAGETLFVRCERQTLRRLPDSGAILFTIGIAVAPLGTLATPQVRQIVTALARQPDDELARRAAPGYQGAIEGYAAARERIDIALPLAHAATVTDLPLQELP